MVHFKYSYAKPAKVLAIIDSILAGIYLISFIVLWFTSSDHIFMNSTDTSTYSLGVIASSLVSAIGVIIMSILSIVFGAKRGVKVAITIGIITLLLAILLFGLTFAMPIKYYSNYR